MKTKIIEENPIELLRFKEGMTQKEFAEKLGYKDKSNYQQHMNFYSEDIITRIKSVYQIDLSYDIIRHLSYLQRKKKTKNKVNKRSGMVKEAIDNLNIFDEFLKEES